MAAFPFKHQQFLPDSVFFPSSPQVKMPGYLEESNNYNSPNGFLFPQIYQPQLVHQEEVPEANGSVRESSFCSPEQQMRRQEHEPSITITNHNNNNNNNIISMDSSSVTDKPPESSCDQQVISQIQEEITAPTMVDKKRKKKYYRQGSSVNSAQSKDMSTEILNAKKQKKCNAATENAGETTNQPREAKKDLNNQQEAPKGYIHVRARRGQATDSHSLAERVRREKISERMKILQALVPGCDKVTGKALMLDEIINYVQSLQHQVEFLSMKLASVNPMFYDFGMDLDAFMVKTDQHQSLSGLAPNQPNGQQCSPTEAPEVGAGASNIFFTGSSCNNNYSVSDNSAASLLFQQTLPHNHQVLWDMDEQRQRLINQSGIINTNLSSFH